MPGAAPQAEIVIRSLPESGLLLSKIPVLVELANGGEPRTIEWAAGRYEVFRRVKLTVGSWTMDVPCDRRIVTVTAGKTEEVKFTRSREDAAVAKGQWPDLASHGVAGAFLTVHPIADKILNAGDPDAYFDFEIDRETLIATTCGPDGKFTLEPLPVGRYVVVLRAFREPAANSGGPSLPYLVGVNTFNVLSENRGVYFYPNDFRVRPRWNTPTWSPTRVAAGDAADRPKNGAAAFGQVPVDSTANSAGNTLSSGLFPGRFGGVSQNMRIDADGGISYGDAKNPCQMTLFNDDRLQIGFLNERQIRTDVTLPLTTGAGGQQRAVWSAEVDGYAYQATAIPVAACGCVFRLEKRLDGKLVHGSLQFFAVKSRQAGAELDMPAAPIDYRDWRVDQSRTGVVAGSYTGASRPMRIAADGTVSYSDQPPGICHLTVLDDNRLTATFRDERGVPAEMTLQLVTTAAQHRASWADEVDGYGVRATAIPYSDNVYVFRLEKYVGGKLTAGEEQFYAIDQKLRKATAEEKAQAARDSNTAFLKHALDAATRGPQEQTEAESDGNGTPKEKTEPARGLQWQTRLGAQITLPDIIARLKQQEETLKGCVVTAETKMKQRTGLSFEGPELEREFKTEFRFDDQGRIYSKQQGGVPGRIGTAEVLQQIEVGSFDGHAVTILRAATTSIGPIAVPTRLAFPAKSIRATISTGTGTSRSANGSPRKNITSRASTAGETRM